MAADIFLGERRGERLEVEENGREVINGLRLFYIYTLLLLDKIHVFRSDSRDPSCPMSTDFFVVVQP